MYPAIAPAPGQAGDAAQGPLADCSRFIEDVSQFGPVQCLFPGREGRAVPSPGRVLGARWGEIGRHLFGLMVLHSLCRRRRATRVGEPPALNNLQPPRSSTPRLRPVLAAGSRARRNLAVANRGTAKITEHGVCISTIPSNLDPRGARSVFPSSSPRWRRPFLGGKVTPSQAGRGLGLGVRGVMLSAWQCLLSAGISRQRCRSAWCSGHSRVPGIPS